MDFFKIRERVVSKNSGTEIFPEFVVGKSRDIMIRGKAFMAIYDPETNLWSTDEGDVQRLVDNELRKYYNEHHSKEDDFRTTVRYMSNFSSNSWVNYCTYLSKMFDNYHTLDNKIIFSNTPVKKEDYVSHKLDYPLEAGDYSAWDELVGTLYEPFERHKIEWSIGAVVSGDSKNIQKFIVLYGPPGSGKSTILDVIEKLFSGYTTTFQASQLVKRNNQFGTAAFKSNPLVALQRDGDLSKIEDNSTLNTIVAHEPIQIRDLYERAFTSRVNAFLFMASNKPVMITDAKSGLNRRLIDVHPSGRKIPVARYSKLMNDISYELGAIADHSLKVYKKSGKHYYDAYRPIDMIERTDVMFNFVQDSAEIFRDEKYVTLKQAWSMYREYVEDASLSYSLPKFKFRDELKDYFTQFSKDICIDGIRVSNAYIGFKSGYVANGGKPEEVELVEEGTDGLIFDKTDSLLDNILGGCPAQYAADDGRPQHKWKNVQTLLKDIDSHRLHYVQVPKNHIVIDFDLKDENGEKSKKLNLEAAAKFPPTYGEFSQGGSGVHLHYIYQGNPERLSNVYSDGIEIKVFTGNSSLRRRVTKCNDIPVATISSGLPLKGDKKVINYDGVKSEKKLRELIERNLRKDIHPGTKPSIDFIYKLLTDAYNSGLKYDVRDLRPRVDAFANNSTHHSDYCVALVCKMPFKSEDDILPGSGKYADNRLVFFDVEVFPNLFLVNWKYDSEGTWGWNEDHTRWVLDGDSTECVRMVNPTPQDIEELFKYKLVGFNNRKYDNHILYARYLGYSNQQLYELSQRIVSNHSKNCTFSGAFNVSYTDIYDFASSANKKSLKKWEIELGLHHQELGLPWDQPVPEEQWEKVAEYCDNDVKTTEAVFHYLRGDYEAREILAAISGLTVNDTTNQQTIKIIFGNNKHPELVYTDLSKTFPGYEYKDGHNLYRGEDVGKGGYVFATPGMYGYSVTLDVASMHPHSIIAMNCFGEYTKQFEDLVDIRLLIKHGEYDKAGELLGGKLKPYLKNKSDAKALSSALKTAINSVYGLTSASFDNPFKDPRNVNNIVALRGALFMVNLKHEVQDRGFTVIHIKTDSIKIANPTQDILNFCIDYGKKYGYAFETEAIWDRICLVNHAVLIGKQRPDSPNWNEEKYPGGWWAVGAQFAQPYVFKTLFTHQKIDISDYFETKSVTTSLYLDMNERQIIDIMNDPEYVGKTYDQIETALAKDQENKDLHNYIFVGRAGLFVPIKHGCGGGMLVRLGKDGKYASVVGTKGHRWLEVDYAKFKNRQEIIDVSYAEEQAEKARHDISEFGDFEAFVA